MAPYVEGNYNMVVYDCQSWAGTFVGYDAYWPIRLLNPYAREWDPYTNKAPEQDRCLFLTFSNGYPLNQRQIRAFFTR
ncbi:hypothetical protein TorRG33x02_257770 [Trema orientale]|uniref:Uncharacterized protein n=1 Tax=Trema orientale TaxID=63057 RepID=A0A2P5DAB8_TREOI|nr:hypothetical protein TorRG33x02_257770 [Trema orientale]